MCLWPSPHVSQTIAASQADLAPLCNQASWSVAPENSLHDSIEMHAQVDDHLVQGSRLQNIVLFRFSVGVLASAQDRQQGYRITWEVPCELPVCFIGNRQDC